MGQARQHIGETLPHILLDQARHTEGCKQTKVVNMPARHRYAHPAVEMPAPCWYVCHVIDMPILPSIIDMPSCCQYTCPLSIGLSSIHLPTIPRRHTHPAVDMPTPLSIHPSRCHCCGPQCWRRRGRGPWMPTSLNEGRGKERVCVVSDAAGSCWVGGWCSGGCGWGGNGGVNLRGLPRSGYSPWPRQSGRTWGWGWWWEREEVMWQFPTGSSHRWLESL